MFHAIHKLGDNMKAAHIAQAASFFDNSPIPCAIAEVCEDAPGLEPQLSVIYRNKAMLAMRAYSGLDFGLLKAEYPEYYAAYIKLARFGGDNTFIEREPLTGMTYALRAYQLAQNCVIITVQEFTLTSEALSSKADERGAKTLTARFAHTVIDKFVDMEYEYIALIDKRSETINMLKQRDDCENPPRDGDNYTLAFNAIAPKLTLDADRKDFLEKMSLGRIMAELAAKTIYVCSFNVPLSSGGVARKKWQFTYLDGDKNLIAYTRSDVTDLYRAELDPVSGLYNKAGFCRAARELMNSMPEVNFVIVRWDIDAFKVYNDVFGISAGDNYLCAVGDAYTRRRWHQSTDIVSGRLEADHFVSCLPLDRLDIGALTRQVRRYLTQLRPDYELTPRFGMYKVEDRTMDIVLMCDRALIALRSTKGQQSEDFAIYNESMREALIDEYMLFSEIKAAMERKEFGIYLQPQYNQADGTLVSAEALVRWFHPEKGLIPPGRFIPLLERNGYITKLDEYVWETACALIRKWILAGFTPVPISVNMSRLDVYNPKLVDTLTGLIERYGIPNEYLRLEITEIAYMEKPSQLIEVVGRLREKGFFIEMDDFGSGFSSLNTLKDVKFDMLKLDLKFLTAVTDDERSGIILSSIVRMARWLNVPVMAEGVETHLQADYLKTIGCSLVQGYLFAKPMPVEAFETLLRREHIGPTGTGVTMGSFFNNAEFWRPEAQATLIFNSFVGAAGIFEYHDDNVEALRLNDKYFDTVGVSREMQIKGNGNLLDNLFPEDRDKLLNMLFTARDTDQEAESETRWMRQNSISGYIWLKTRVRCIAKSTGRFVVYAAIENVTARKLTEEHERLRTEELRMALRERHAEDERNRILMERTSMCVYDYDFRNDIMRAQLSLPGKGIEQRTIPDYYRHFLISDFVHEDYKQTILDIAKRIGAEQASGELDFLALRYGHAYRWCRLHYVSVADETGDVYRIVGQVDDIQAEKDRDLLVSSLNSRLAMKTDSSSVGLNEIIAERVFRLLYEAEDVEDAIAGILEVLGNYYDVSRVYIFEDSEDHSYCVNTFEWCADGVTPEIENLKHLSYDEVLSGYKDSFNSNGVFFCPDVSLLPKKQYDILSPQGIFSMLHCAIMDNGVFSGYIGYDECRGKREWTKEQVATLTLISKLIGAFLMKKRREDEAAFSQDFVAAIDFFSAYTYIINPDTYEIIFCNKAIRDHSGDSLNGKRCYDVFCGISEPCKNCPSHALVTKGCAQPTEIRRADGVWMIAQASPLHWNERNMVLLSCTDISDRKNMEEELKIREEEYRVATEQSSKHVMRYDLATRTISRTYSTDDLFLTTGDISTPQGVVASGLMDEENSRQYLGFFALMHTGKPTGSVNLNVRRADGEYRWYQMEYTLVFDDGTPRQAVVSYYDNTAQREKELAYEKWRVALATMLTDSALYCEADLTLNRIEREEGKSALSLGINGRLTLEDYVERHIAKFVYAGDRRRYRKFLSRERLISLYQNGIVNDYMECRMVIDKSPMWHRIDANMVKDPYTDTVKTYLLFADVNKQRVEQEDLARLATRDAVTGLLNRGALEKNIQESLSKTDEDMNCALFIIDLDNFKRVNDTLGHQRGDDVLHDAARIISHVFRPGDIVGRLGGDEYAVFMTMATEHAVRTRASELVEQLQFSLGAQGEVTLSASVGAVLCAGGEDNFSKMYKLADAALYAAKNQGKSCYHIVSDTRGAASPPEPDEPRVNSTAIQYKALLDYMDGGVALFEVADELELIYASPSYITALGRPAEYFENHGEKLFTMLYEDDLKLLEQTFHDCIEKKCPVDVTVRAWSDTGETVWRHVRAVEIPYEKSHNPVILAIVTDVSELKRSNEMFEAIARHSPVGIAIYDIGDTLKAYYYNDEFIRLTELSRERFKATVANDLALLFDPDDMQLLSLTLEDTAATGHSGYIVCRTNPMLISPEKRIDVRAVKIGETSGVTRILMMFS